MGKNLSYTSVCRQAVQNLFNGKSWAAGYQRLCIYTKLLVTL